MSGQAEDRSDIAESSKRAGSPSAPPASKRHAAAAPPAAEHVDLTADDAAPAAPPLFDPAFRLLKVREGLIPAWANEGFLGTALPDLVVPGIRWALVSNYMVDLAWLLSACPALTTAERVVLVHGERGGGQVKIQQDIAAAGLQGRVVTHFPRLPQYGTHHSKAFFLQYRHGLRVVVFTANAIYCDCNNKSQGVWAQDFPLRGPGAPASSPFQLDLQQYVAELGLPAAAATQAQQIIAQHDFSAARAHLIASVPGAGAPHHGDLLHAYGHMKLRKCLNKESGGFPAHFRAAPVLAQYSSVGSLSSPWLLDQFLASLSAGHSNGQQLGRPPVPSGLHLVWPTVSEVQNSVEGWFAGGSIPGRPDNVTRPFLRQYYRQWGGAPAGRQRAMPHIKTFCRFDPGSQELAWFCVTSHNLSKAAWGEVQESKVNRRTQLKILSFELGVLLVPSLERSYQASRWRGFNAVDGTAAGPLPGAAGARVRFVAWQRGEPQHAALRGSVLTVPLPVPYALPPEAYAAGDSPWDVRDEKSPPWPGLDALGCQFPGRGRHYGVLQQQSWADVVGQ